MEVLDPRREEKVPRLLRLYCTPDHLFLLRKLNDGEYMVKLESSLLQGICFSRRLFDMQKLITQSF